MKQPLLPKLRFPEFQKEPGWEEKTLAAISESISSGKDKANSKGVFDLYGSTGIIGTTENATYSGEYILVARVGANAGFLTKATGNFGVTDNTLVIMLNTNTCFDFVHYYLKNIGLNKMIFGSGQPLITGGQLKSLAISFPSLAEQRRIADCLSSLDELIAAEGRKWEHLRTYKKGLMQQLFPRVGERVPRLRFPEFRNAGEWEEKPLGEVIIVASGQIDPTERPYCDFPQIGSENIESDTGKLVNVKSAAAKGVISGNYSFDENDILYSKIRPALNKVAAPGFKGICSADIYPVRPARSDLDRSYLLYLLLSEAFLDYAIRNSARGKIPKINREALLTYRALIPNPAEQRRIAESLSALDAQIAAQSEKLVALRTHKKGLMQQLFP
ncbi:MAG: restriction endonuclease subunit S [Bacteroidales bacterium]|nr:restriction endonuclease subunit S [Bacteroidales bacterium]